MDPKHWASQGMKEMAMSDKRDDSNVDESEFGLGEGMIDDRMRADRAIPEYMQGWEIKALPKTFDGSMPTRPTVETAPVPRLAPGETEADRA